MTTPDEPQQPPFAQEPPPYGGYPPQYGYPPQGYGQPGYPPSGYPGYGQPGGQPGYPPAGYPPAGYPGYPPGAYPGYAPVAAFPFTPASMGQRFLARLVDALVLFVPMIVLFVVFIGILTADTTSDCSGVDCGPSGLGIAAIAGLVALYGFLLVGPYAYAVYFIGKKGQTIGKKVMGIKVVDSRTGGNIGYGKAFARELLQGLCLLVAISPFFDNTQRNQGWHDKVADDFVIRVK